LRHKTGSRLEDERNDARIGPMPNSQNLPVQLFLKRMTLSTWGTQNQKVAGLKPPEIVGPTREDPKYLFPLFWIYLFLILKWYISCWL